MYIMADESLMMLILRATQHKKKKKHSIKHGRLVDMHCMHFLSLPCGEVPLAAMINQEL